MLGEFEKIYHEKWAFIIVGYVALLLLWANSRACSSSFNGFHEHINNHAQVHLVDFMSNLTNMIVDNQIEHFISMVVKMK